MKLNAFTLIELLVTTTIIIIMAAVAIPTFNKHQTLIDLQSKSNEIKADLDGMQIKALNASQGITRYYAYYDYFDIEYGSWNGTSSSVYKTINFPDYAVALYGKRYIVCDKGKSYCCLAQSVDEVCATTSVWKSGEYLSIGQAGIGAQRIIKIFADPFRVKINEGEL